MFLTVLNPTDGSNAVANLIWASWLYYQITLNDNGVYTDMHDGTAMGGLVVSVDRPSFPNSVLDRARRELTLQWGKGGPVSHLGGG
jgi:hypothetical protein